MTRKLRVLFVFQSLEGRGPERVALNIVSHLDRSLFEPSLWVLKPDEDLRADVPSDVPIDVALADGARIRQQLPRMWRSLVKRAREADVIVATVELLPTYLAFAAGVAARKPVLGWVHNQMDRVFAAFPKWNFHASKFVYRRLARTVSVSQGVQDTLRRLQDLPSDRLLVLHNPQNLRAIEARRDEALPDWAAFMSEQPTILAAGRLTHQKGFDLLIDAHARLRERGSRHNLVILGRGELHDELKRQASDLGVADSVFLPGFTANPYAFMRHATAFALSSRYEGLVGVVVEAMACGLPVVAFDCPSGTAELLQDGRCGLLAPPEDVSALADRLGEVLRDEKLRRHLSEQGTRRALDFAPERIVPQWEQLLADVVVSPAVHRVSTLNSSL
ncbi:glycosyltransferase [Deinococcus yavapaiensis]|uniref:Glycosyltransferase involved in cell wall biosynthesis n=1 Tax=Deinococcus yavapaiensis KR-236 TaxID=694435 RepID=A0A318SEU9_9DEIO|nr:glycosyltransferase [Deinococcus yavapaiensis]PYE55755.1 glycosyltransferase involved in cell wall biosynthesis [Deinococcus yavapaiensis KR-236]